MAKEQGCKRDVFFRDQDETETIRRQVSRPSPDQDVENKTSSLGKSNFLIQQFDYENTIVVSAPGIFIVVCAPGIFIVVSLSS